VEKPASKTLGDVLKAYSGLVDQYVECAAGKSALAKAAEAALTGK
jgi:hypothetical protein